MQVSLLFILIFIIVYQGCGISLDHYSVAQYDKVLSNSKYKVKYADRKAGDIIFFKNSSGTVCHVGVLASASQFIEAPGHDSNCNGIKVRTNSVSAKAVSYFFLNFFLIGKNYALCWKILLNIKILFD